MQSHVRGRPPAEVAVVIVAFNSGAWLDRAITRVLESTIPVSVIVSDNGSTDGSITRVRDCWGGDDRVRIIAHGRNLGFATAVNRAIEQSDEPTVLLLNPDCEVQPETIERVLAALRDDGVAGMAGPRVCNPDGSEQAGGRRLDPTPQRVLAWAFERPMRWLGRSPRSFNLNGQPLPPGPVPVEAISGAFMLVEREAIGCVGPMDEGYFLHGEDLDWCRRFRDAGYHVLFVPDAIATHAKGTSSSGRPVRTEWHKHRGMVRYYRKFAGTTPRDRLALAAASTLVWAHFLLVLPRLLVVRFRVPSRAVPPAD
ncbi:glycosyltransferase family 2 protein [Thioalkalivibrio sp. ALE9]|uniref:glycosyltransferase family 2 protein n=1 Tax=Thioalkalivibrio sp. ALE9 TaxID=1158169 RepID=UPI00037174BE|nr:glycosyltransferase family 2 protein [Thioalkalivibrio sp. ALE9]